MMFSTRFIFAISIACICILTSCATKKKKPVRKSTSKPRTSTPKTTNPKPQAEGEILALGPDEVNLDMKESNLNINFQLNKEAVNDTFNKTIDTLLNNNTLKIEEYNMDVMFQKKGDGSIEFEGKKVLIQFPLEIIAEKETFINKVKAAGLLQLTIISKIDIDRDWNLVTETYLEDYYWKEQPEFKMGILKIPIEKIMNIIIEKSKARIIAEIDHAVQEKLDLRAHMLTLSQYVSESFQVDEMSDTWLTIDLDKIKMSQILNVYDWMEGSLSMDGISKITHSPEQKDIEASLPSFNWLKAEDKVDTSHLYFNVDLEFKRINDLINERFVGMRFSEGDKEITLRKVELKGQDDKLGVIADVTGSYNGQIFLSGVPKYEASSRNMKTEDIEVKLLTKNVLHKALGWMLKGRIKKELGELMQFSLSDFLGSIQESIDDQIKSIHKDGELEIMANIQDLDIKEFRFSKEKLHTSIHAPIHINVKIFNLLSLDKLTQGRSDLPD